MLFSLLVLTDLNHHLLHSIVLVLVMYVCFMGVQAGSEDTFSPGDMHLISDSSFF